MHSAETVAEVLKLAESGLGARRIAAQTGLPVRTITDWLAGRTPRGWRSERRPRCELCGAASHRISDAAAYAYLLGAYLGDGHVSTHPRGVFKLRIFLDNAYPQIIDACQAAICALVPSKVNRRRCAGCLRTGLRRLEYSVDCGAQHHLRLAQGRRCPHGRVHWTEALAALRVSLHAAAD